MAKERDEAGIGTRNSASSSKFGKGLRPRLALLATTILFGSAACQIVEARSPEAKAAGEIVETSEANDPPVTNPTSATATTTRTTSATETMLPAAKGAKQLAISACADLMVQVDSTTLRRCGDSKGANDVCCDHAASGKEKGGLSCGSIQTDRRNCGGCGKKCDEGEQCQDGRCTHPEGTKQCVGEWVALSDDRANCGTCGHKCKEFCMEGKCKSCDKGFNWCEAGNNNDEGCANLQEDWYSCGKCNHRCPRGYDCIKGHCEP